MRFVRCLKCSKPAREIGGKRDCPDCGKDLCEECCDGRCRVPPEGWFCTRDPGHPGPCAAYPIEKDKPQQ